MMSNLIKQGHIVTDEWTQVHLPALPEEAVRKQAGKVVIFKLTGEVAATPEQIAGTEIPVGGKVLIPLSVWLARRGSLSARLERGEVGVWLESFELVEDLVASVDDLNRLPVIGVHFPRFADGRGFSIATLLRTRYGYRNELRALGDVLRDQLFYMKRCGFDAYLMRPDRSTEEALASLRDFSEPYQAAVDNPLPVWRRYTRVAQHSHASTRTLSAHEDEVD